MKNTKKNMLGASKKQILDNKIKKNVQKPAYNVVNVNDIAGSSEKKKNDIEVRRQRKKKKKKKKQISKYKRLSKIENYEKKKETYKK